MLERSSPTSPSRGLGYGVHVVITASRTWRCAPRSRTSCSTASNSASATPWTPSSTARSPPTSPPASPAAARPPRSSTSWPPSRASTRAAPADGTRRRHAPPSSGRPREAWQGPPAPAVRLLPRKVPRRPASQGLRPPGPRHRHRHRRDQPRAGLSSTSKPTRSSSSSAKANPARPRLLRLLAHQITERYTADEAKIVVGDYRRSLLGAVSPDPPPRIRRHRPALTGHMEALAGLMERRRPGPDVTPQQLRDRSWWSGPQFFVVIDDYDLVDLVQPATRSPCSPRTSPSPAMPASASSSPAAPPECPGPCSSPSSSASRSSAPRGVVLSGDPHEGRHPRHHPPPPHAPGARLFRFAEAGDSLGAARVAARSAAGANGRAGPLFRCPAAGNRPGRQGATRTGALNAAAIPYCVCHSVRHVPDARNSCSCRPSRCGG